MVAVEKIISCIVMEVSCQSEEVNQNHSLVTEFVATYDTVLE